MPSSNAPRITHKRRLVMVSAIGATATVLTPSPPGLPRSTQSRNVLLEMQPWAADRPGPPDRSRRPEPPALRSAAEQCGDTPCRMEIKEGQGTHANSPHGTARCRAPRHVGRHGGRLLLRV